MCWKIIASRLAIFSVDYSFSFAELIVLPTICFQNVVDQVSVASYELVYLRFQSMYFLVFSFGLCL